MWTKALWMKEYKQSKVLIWGLLGILIFDLPIRISLALESWRVREEEAAIHGWEAPPIEAFQVKNLFGGSFSTILGIILIVLLAGLLIGAERNTRKNDFSFALPYKRSEMFLTKWALGMLSILVFFTVNFFIAYFIVLTSEFGHLLEGISLMQIYVSPIVGFLVMFSFAMLMGTISGEMVSQMVLTFIFTFFPIGFVFLIQGFWGVHTDQYMSEPSFLMNFVWPIYNVDAIYFQRPIIIPIIATILFTVIAVWLYSKNKIEHNGEFLIFKQLQPIFRVGIIVCFSLLGGITIAGLAPYTSSNTLSIVFYWVGFLLFSFLSYLLTNRLFSMNVTIKNK